MPIEHKDIPEAQLHEPKGASTASANNVYVANGSGSGTWSKVASTALSGLSGDGGSSNKRIITNGSNGFSIKTDLAYGGMGITNNGNAFAVTVAGDLTLKTNTDYVLFTGVGAPWSSENLFGGVTFSTDRLTAPVNGLYRVYLAASIYDFPGTHTRLGFKIRINGSAYSSRNFISKADSATDERQLFGYMDLTLAAGEYVQLYVASTDTGNFIINDCLLTLNMIRDTT